MNEISKEINDAFVGLTISEAEKILGDLSLTRIRPVIINGEHRVVTMDYDPNRLNVELTNDIITKVISLA
jgi:hypothetical protein